MKKTQNGIVLIVPIFIALSSVVAVIWAQGTMSPRAFGLVCLALVGLLAFVITRVFMQERNSSASSTPVSGKPDVGRSLWRLKAAVIALPILLAVGLLVTQGQPLWPRAVGAGINILITAWFASILKRVSSAKNKYPRAD